MAATTVTATTMAPTMPPIAMLRAVGFAVVTAMLAVAAPTQGKSPTGAPPDAHCQHLIDLLTIERRLSNDLKLDKVRVRCGPRTQHENVDFRPVSLLRMPPVESSIRLNRADGRLVSLHVQRLPIPRLAHPKAGWPALGALERIARTQAEIPSDAALTRADTIDTTDSGLAAGAYPYARFMFEHVVEGALVVGDRIEAHVDLRSANVSHLDARRWTPVTAPMQRITEGRARKIARKALRKLDPDALPCCQKPRVPLRAGESLAVAAKAPKTDKSGKKARRRRGKRSGPQITITCDTRLRRRVYLHDRKGVAVEAYEFGCEPTCDRDGVVQKCGKDQAALVYITTEKGQVLGMKGQLAPDHYRWQRPKTKTPAALPLAQLHDRAELLLTTAIERLEPDAELKDPRCPAGEDDATVHHRCWHLMIPAMHFRAKSTRTNVVFELPQAR